MTCHEARELFSAFVDDELDPRERSALDAHLVGCADCRRELDRFFREQGIEMRMAMQFDNIQMIKEAVALGSGISILPARTMLAEVEQGRLVAVPLHAPDLVRPLGIVHRKRKKFNRAAQSFLELLQEAPDRVGAGV